MRGSRTVSGQRWIAPFGSRVPGLRGAWGWYHCRGRCGHGLRAGRHRQLRPPLSDDAIAASNPVIVVEILSPSTEHIDLADKLADYFRLASVQHYLIVQVLRREVIHHRRSGEGIISRVINIGDIVLDPPGITIGLADIYRAKLDTPPRVRRDTCQ